VPQRYTLITSQQLMDIPYRGAYPEKGSKIVDPSTGFIVSRIADSRELLGDYLNNPSNQSLIVYSRYSAENTTGELYIVHGTNSTSAWIYRRSNNTLVTVLRFNPSLGSQSRSIGEVNELRWDYTGQHPNRLYFVGRSLPTSQAISGENPAMSFYYLDINPNTNSHSPPVLVRDFSLDFPDFPGAAIMNDVEGDSSNDSRFWAWQVVNPLGTGNMTYGIFSYDKNLNSILGRLQRSCKGATLPCVTAETPSVQQPYITRPNMVEFSPLGSRVIVHFERVYPGYGRDSEINTLADGPKAFAPDFSDPIRIAADATHSGWAWGQGGEELFVSQNNRNDWVEAVDIKDAASANCSLISGTQNSYSCGTKIVSQPQLDPSYAIGFHFGKIYDKSKRGWVFVNTYGKAESIWSRNQNLLVRIQDAYSSGAAHFVRLGSSLNDYYDYRSEGSGALSFNGNSIYSTGNWGFTDGRGDVVRTDLPPDLFSNLPKSGLSRP